MHAFSSSASGAATPIALVPDHRAPAGDCRLWLIDLRAPLDEAAWQACSEAEHTRAARFRFDKHASRYRAAHAGMRRLLSQELALAPELIAYTEGPEGKPGLANTLGDAPELHFNLSHSGDWALLGISRTHRIGVDIECHKELSDMAAMSMQVFNETEQDAFAACPPPDQATFFFRTWAGKEACLKALGSGLSVDPRCVHGAWSPNWLDASIQVPARGAEPARIHGMRMLGLTLPIQSEAVEAAVALW